MRTLVCGTKSLTTTKTVHNVGLKFVFHILITPSPLLDAASNSEIFVRSTLKKPNRPRKMDTQWCQQEV